MDGESPSVALARELIARESITPDDAGCQQLLRARLEKIGFSCESMSFERVVNLWAVREPESSPQSPQSPLLVFAGHTDVVPTGPRENWKYPPFEAVVDNGVLFGRGAADMKGGLACFVVACEQFIADHPDHAGAIGLLITSDEEGEARFGTREVMRVLESRGVKIDMCLVGEPSSADALGDTIKVGRRGSCGGVLRVSGEQGHIAYPADNPIHRAVAVVDELRAMEWDGENRHDNDDGGENAAPANQSDNQPANQPASQSTCQYFPPTSFQVSNFNAGTGADNVIPGEAVVNFNLRYSPQISHSEIRARIEAAAEKHAPDKWQIDWRAPCPPFASGGGKLTQALVESIEAQTGRAPIKSTAGGTSDGRFIAPSGAEVVELGVINATIHQIDECVSTADLDILSAIYRKVLEKVLA